MTDTKQFKSLEVENRQRNAIRIGWIITGMAALLMLWGVYSFYRNPDMARVIFMIFYIVLLLAGLANIRLSSRGHSDAGSLIIIGLILVMVLAIGAILVGQGLIFLMLSILMVSVISIVALSPRYQPYTIAVSIIAGLFVLFFDQYVVADWRREALSRSSTAIIGTVILIAYVVFLARQLRNFSLRAKLILAFLIVCLAAVGVVAGLTNLAVQAELAEASERVLLVGAAQISTLLDAFIQNNLDVVQVEAQNTDIVDLLELPPAERDESAVAEEVALLLQGYHSRDPEFISSYALLDASGLDVLDTHKPDIGTLKVDADYFQEPLKSGQVYVSPVFFSSSDSSPGIYFSAPVQDGDGNILGVLSFRYDAAILHELISGASDLAGEQSFAVLLDEHGIRLAHGLSDDNLFKSVIPLDPAAIGDLRDQGRLPDLPVEQLSTDLPEFAAGLANTQQDSVFATPLNALDEKMAVGSVHRLDNQSWSLVLFQPQDVYLSPVRTQTRMLTLLGVFVAFLVTGSAAFVAQWLSRPITYLTEVAEKVGEGDLNVRADLQTLDEVGTLAKVFNSMTDQLAQTIGTLEQQVSERTRALETSAEVSRRLSTILDQQQLVHEVVEQLQSAFGYYHVHIYLFDAGKQNLLMVGGTGDAGQAMLARGHKIGRGRGLVGRAAENNSVVLVPDVSQAEGWLSNPLLPETKAEVAVPIAIGPDVLGVLDVQDDVVGGLEQKDAELIQTIANQVAIAVQNAQAYGQAQQRAEREARIAAVSQRIQAAVTVDDVLKVAVSELGQVLGAQRSSVDLKLAELKTRGKRS